MKHLISSVRQNWVLVAALFAAAAWYGQTRWRFEENEKKDAKDHGALFSCVSNMTQNLCVFTVQLDHISNRVEKIYNDLKAKASHPTTASAKDASPPDYIQSP